MKMKEAPLNKENGRGGFNCPFPEELEAGGHYDGPSLQLASLKSGGGKPTRTTIPRNPRKRRKEDLLGERTFLKGGRHEAREGGRARRQSKVYVCLCLSTQEFNLRLFYLTNKTKLHIYGLMM